MLGTLDIFLLAFTRVYLIFDCLEQIRLLFFILWLYCAWEIFYSHSLPRVELVGVFRDDARQVDATYKAIVDDEPLRSVLTRSLNGNTSILSISS